MNVRLWKSEVVIADHAPHELLGMDDYFRPAILAGLAVAALVVLVCRRVEHWSFLARLGLAAATAAAAVLPATIAGYCSRSQFVVATFVFAAPVIIALARRGRDRRDLRVAAWVAAGVAVVAYIAAVRSSCWDDSYEFDNTGYQIKLVAPSALLAGGVMYRPEAKRVVQTRLAAAMSALTSTRARVQARVPRIPPASPERLAVIMRYSALVRWLLLAPIVAGVVMLPTVLLTVLGVALLAMSAGLWRAATSAIAGPTIWTLQGSILLAFALMCTVVGCIAILAWAAGEGFSFSSSWSELGILFCLAWSAGMVTAGTRILSRRT